VDCETVQRRLVLRLETDPPVREHLESCDECRRFATDLEAIASMAHAPVETPPALKDRVLETCREAVSARSRRLETSLWHRFRRLCASPRFVLATAVLGVLILIALEITKIDESLDRQIAFLIRLALVQIALQNLAAALVLPALLPRRFGFTDRYRRVAHVTRTEG
jgi:predicted anti-sigma-YlaC factor YlaD